MPTPCTRKRATSPGARAASSISWRIALAAIPTGISEDGCADGAAGGFTAGTETPLENHSSRGAKRRRPYRLRLPSTGHHNGSVESQVFQWDEHPRQLDLAVVLAQNPSVRIIRTDKGDAGLPTTAALWGDLGSASD
jgi:hypothetical protein